MKVKFVITFSIILVILCGCSKQNKSVVKNDGIVLKYIESFLEDHGFTKSIEKMNLQEFKDIADNFYLDEARKEHAIIYSVKNWGEDIDYKIVYGIFYHNSFFILYNKEGRYIDGYYWQYHYSDDIPNVKYLEEFNTYQISPVGFDRGTGTSIHGRELLTVQDNQLVNILSYPTSIELCGVERYKYLYITMKDSIINGETGNLTIKYQVTMYKDDEKIERIKEVQACYKDSKFDIEYDSIYSFINNYILGE